VSGAGMAMGAGEALSFGVACAAFVFSEDASGAADGSGARVESDVGTDGC
jgi:hypothetical protein